MKFEFPNDDEVSHEDIAQIERESPLSLEGPMAELLAMSGKENEEVFRSTVLGRFGIDPETINLLDDRNAREYMKNFVSPLFDDEIKERAQKDPELLNVIAQEAADELRRLTSGHGKKAA